MSVTLSKPKIPHVKRSITLRKDYDEFLRESDEKASTIINASLELYFSRKQALEKAEKVWMETYLEPAFLDIKNGDVIDLSPSISREERDTLIFS